MRPDLCIEFWEGETRQDSGERTLIRSGGYLMLAAADSPAQNALTTRIRDGQL
jgi:hypothetical protein